MVGNFLSTPDVRGILYPRMMGERRQSSEAKPSVFINIVILPACGEKSWGGGSCVVEYMNMIILRKYYPIRIHSLF